MDLRKEKYVILEIIPTKLMGGDVAQISALKIDGIKLVDRFDYRLDKAKIDNVDILNMINYDNEMFKYVKTTKSLMNSFKKFIDDLPLLIIDNTYTRNYLSDINNKKESIFKYLGLEVDDEVFSRLMNKCDLEPSNYLVDLLYEALIKEL